jgi:hypothetical protein
MPYATRISEGAAGAGGCTEHERADQGALGRRPRQVQGGGPAGILASYGGMEVVAEVPNDEEALRLARKLLPGVIIMQAQMPFERS